MSDMNRKPIRACTNCVRAKAKCSPGVPERCDRCTRTNKECVPSPPVRKRRAARISKNSQVQKLEERIDGLVVLLQSAINPSSTSSTVEESQSSDTRLRSLLPEVLPRRHTAVNTVLINRQPSLSPASLQLLDPTDAEQTLDRFRNVMLPNLPFIVLSPSLSAQDLRQENPLLWMSIMAVASSRPTQQSALSEEARAIFAREAYVAGSRSLDFLWAVLVFVTWDRFHTYGKCPSMALVHLAVAIMYDLALDKPLSFDAGLGLMYDVKGMKKSSVAPRAPGLKEKRAVLGCFLVGTVRSMQGKGESLKWTPIFDWYLRELEEQKEAPSDLILVQLVKLRLVTENATEYLALGTDDGIEPTAGPDATAVLKSLESQLRTVKSQIPSDLLNNQTILLELHNTEATIHQMAFKSADHPFSLHANHRFACLYACMQGVKSWIDTFLAIAPGNYVGFSALTHNGKMRCLLNICRLAICEHPEWDSSLLHGSINVSWALEETAKRMEQAREAAGMEAGDSSVDMHALLAERVRGMKSFWDTMTTTVPTQDLGFMDELGNFSEEFLGFWDWA
ncbi:Zn(II)2Cys6 transcription factor domain-containing protein [Aspergillus undulatus]|uniref:Zn(II)2Cys6 transcription factor domain-containing protein n=1 Tax=Aspergillus undulatus TaxID=1810928 RepID=UPI003CCD94CC